MWLIVSGRVMGLWDIEIITHNLPHKIVVGNGVLKVVVLK